AATTNPDADADANPDANPNSNPNSDADRHADADPLPDRQRPGGDSSAEATCDAPADGFVELQWFERQRRLAFDPHDPAHRHRELRCDRCSSPSPQSVVDNPFGLNRPGAERRPAC